MTTCAWEIPWVGRCRNEAAGQDAMCEEHKDKTCESCGQKADHGCDATVGLVCGFSLCRACEHDYEKGFLRHRAKSV